MSTASRRNLAVALAVLGLAGLGGSIVSRKLDEAADRIAKLEAALSERAPTAAPEARKLPPLTQQQLASIAAKVRPLVEPESAEAPAAVHPQAEPRSTEFREQAEVTRRQYLKDLDQIVAKGTDSDWRPEQSIYKALGSVAAVKDLRCANDLCRVEVVPTNAQDASALSNQIASEPPFASGTIYDRDERTGNTVLNVAREETGFPEI